MIQPGEFLFPNNVVGLLPIAFQAIDPDLFITKRPLRNTDPTQSIGVFGQLWDPDEESKEMHGFSTGEPTLQQYLISIQAFVKDRDPERGLSTHSILSAHIRRVLYNDPELRVALAGLASTDEWVTETLKRWGVRVQRYFSNEIDSDWLYLSTLEFWIETETETR